MTKRFRKLQFGRNNEAEALAFHELARVASGYLGQDAVYHQNFAGNCIENPSEYCLSGGLGPKKFDCSGLIIRSLCDLLDCTIETDGLRHVRDMWRSAEEHTAYMRASLAVGVLAVMRRRYMIDGIPTEIPGHIGVVSSVEDEVTIIHANPRNGKVEQSILRDQTNVMGYIALNLA